MNRSRRMRSAPAWGLPALLFAAAVGSVALCSTLASSLLVPARSISGPGSSAGRQHEVASHSEVFFNAKDREYSVDNPHYRALMDQSNSRVRINTQQAPLVSNMSTMAFREKQLSGVKFDGVLLYQIMWDLNYTKDVVPYLDAGYNVVLCLEIVETFPNLAAIANGRYDTELTTIGKAMALDGRPIGVRPLHEFNGNWYSWGTFYQPTVNLTDFKSAYRRVVGTLLQAGAPAWFQLNYNNINYGGSPLAPAQPVKFSQWYPGDDVVDQVSISGYNRYNLTNGLGFQSFADVIGPAYFDIKNFTDRPIGVGETSTMSAGGNKSQWFLDAFHTAAYNFTHLTEITFFLFNKEADWDLNNAREIAAFRQGILNLRNATANTTYGAAVPTGLGQSSPAALAAFTAANPTAKPAGM